MTIEERLFSALYTFTAMALLAFAATLARYLLLA